MKDLRVRLHRLRGYLAVLRHAVVVRPVAQATRLLTTGHEEVPTTGYEIVKLVIASDAVLRHAVVVRPVTGYEVMIF